MFSGRDEGEYLVFISGPEAAMDMAQMLVTDIINRSGAQGGTTRDGGNEGPGSGDDDGDDDGRGGASANAKDGSRGGASGSGAGQTTTDETDTSGDVGDTSGDTYAGGAEREDKAGEGGDEGNKENEDGGDGDAGPVGQSGSLDAASGSREWVDFAVSDGRMQGHGTGRPGDRSYDGYSEWVSYEMKIPDAKVGMVIGAGGAHIRLLQQKSGTRIAVSKKMDTSQDGNPRAVTITGRKGQVENARRMILGRINRFADGRGSGEFMEQGVAISGVDALAMEFGRQMGMMGTMGMTPGMGMSGVGPMTMAGIGEFGRGVEMVGPFVRGEYGTMMRPEIGAYGGGGFANHGVVEAFGVSGSGGGGGDGGG